MEYHLFFDDEMVDLIIEETNRYGARKDSAYIQTDNI